MSYDRTSEQIDRHWNREYTKIPSELGFLVFYRNIQYKFVFANVYTQSIRTWSHIKVTLCLYIIYIACLCMCIKVDFVKYKK